MSIDSTPGSAAASVPDRRASWREIPAIDGLRGVAVLGVLLFHDGRLPGGFLGVDLFFALSGFLITGLLLHEWTSLGRISLSAFWARRARRLLPAMLAFLVVIVPLMRLWGSPPQLEAAKSGVVPALLYVVNWHQIAAASDYWALFTDPSPMTHLWSLAVEEQFYLVWPAVVAALLTRRHWSRWLLGVIGGGIIASTLAMAILYDPASPTRVYIGTDTRAASLLLGALAAVTGAPSRFERFAARYRQRAIVAQCSVVALLATIWVLADGQSSSWLFRGGFLVHGSLAAVLVSALGVGHATPVQRLLSLRPLRWLGSISYGLYLWHWPVFILLTEQRIGIGGIALSVVRWAASLFIAVVSYHVVENPVRSAHHGWSAGRVRAGVTVATVVAVVLAVAVPQRDLRLPTFDPTTITAATVPSTTLAPPPTGSPSTSAEPPERPLVRSVLLQGDSVAYDAAPGVIAALEASGVVAAESTLLGLGLVATSSGDPIALYRQRIAEIQPDLVVFMLSGWDVGYEPAEQRLAITAYADAVVASGAMLAFLTPPPVDPVVRDDSLEMLRMLADELADDRPDRIVVLDAAGLWGEYRRDMNGDGVPERKVDGIHVCPQGSALLGNWLVAELAALFSGLQPAEPEQWATGPWTTEQRYSDPMGACT